MLTVSGILEGEYGISNAALSLPTKLSGFGVEEILEVPLSDAETQGLRESAATLKKYITELGF